MSMTGSPAASAASRATLPALSPCRTIHKTSGHFCSSLMMASQSFHKLRTATEARRHREEESEIRDLRFQIYKAFSVSAVPLWLILLVILNIKTRDDGRVIRWPLPGTRLFVYP